MPSLHAPTVRSAVAAFVTLVIALAAPAPARAADYAALVAAADRTEADRQNDAKRHPEDERTNIVFKNPMPVDEFVLKFRKP